MELNEIHNPIRDPVGTISAEIEPEAENGMNVLQE